MNPIFQHIITEATIHSLKKGKHKIPKKQVEREKQNFRIIIMRLIRDSILILFGVLSASFSLKAFSTAKFIC